MDALDRNISRRSWATVAAIASGAYATGCPSQPFFPQVALGGETARSNSVPKRRVALTIDDGPASGANEDFDAFRAISSKLRNVFVEQRVPAIMFINERQLHIEGQRDARIDIVKQWLDAGLELGNHTYSHRRLTRVELHEYFDDIVRGEVVSRDLLEKKGQRLTWFRYPFLSSDKGARAKQVEDFLADREYRIAPVTIDYKDYSYSSTYSQRLRAGDKAGLAEVKAAVLKHCDAAFSKAEATSKELLGIEIPQVLLVHCNEMNSDTIVDAIMQIRKRGYEFVSLDEAVAHSAYKTEGLPPGSMGGWFYSGLAEAVGKPKVR